MSTHMTNQQRLKIQPSPRAILRILAELIAASRPRSPCSAIFSAWRFSSILRSVPGFCACKCCAAILRYKSIMAPR